MSCSILYGPLVLVVLLFHLSHTFDIVETTISSINTAFAAGTLNCTTLVRSHLDRILLHDPYVHSMISLNPNALLRAKALDRHPQFGKLWCIPTILKDNIDFELMPSSAGSVSLSTNMPSSSAAVTSRLISEGVVILGKANMAEFASDGLNTNTTIGGQCMNVYVPDRTPYGSSGGVAAAITSSFGVIGIGTDTCGSVVLPSSAASLVGLRPARDMVNDAGIVPLNYRQDVYGVMVRSAVDAATVWDTLVPVPKKEGKKEPRRRKKVAKEWHVAWLSDFLVSVPGQMDPDPAMVSMCNDTLQRMSDFGIKVDAIPLYWNMLKKLKPLLPAFAGCGPSIGRKGLSDYLWGPHMGPIASLQGLFDSEMYGPGIESLLTALLQAKEPSANPLCPKYEEFRNLTRQFIEETLQTKNVDLILYPIANQRPPLLHDLPPSSTSSNSFIDRLLGLPGTFEGWSSLCISSAASGLPSINFPIGYVQEDGSPIGMNAISLQEETLLDFALMMEEKFHYRKTPSL